MSKNTIHIVKKIINMGVENVNNYIIFLKYCNYILTNNQYIYYNNVDFMSGGGNYEKNLSTK